MSTLKQRLSTTNWFLLAALILAWVAALPLLEPHALLNTRGGGDSPFLLQRTHQLLAALRQGQLPVRVMPDGYYGQGYPFFNFYAPLSIYVAAGFKLLGFSFTRAIQLAQLAGFLLAGWGMFALALRMLGNRWGALLASVAYTYAPFHMVNVYVRGDSLAEFWAMAFYPLTLLAAEDVLKANSAEKRVRAILKLGITYACLVLSHNISALIFSPFLLLFCLLGLVKKAGRQSDTSVRRPSSVVHRLFLFALSALLGLLLSAWFWLPALLEQDSVQLGPVTEGFFNYAVNFRGSDIVQRSLLFRYVVTATQDPFRMGLVQTVLGGLGLIAMLMRWRMGRLEARHALFCVVTVLLATFMILPQSVVLWDWLPLLEFTQFPWRFLSVQALAGSLLIGFLVPFGQDLVMGSQSIQAALQIERVGKQPLAAAFAIGLIVMIVWSGLRLIQPDYLYLTDADVTAERLIEYEWFTGNVGTTISAEYLPEDEVPRLWTGSNDLSAVEKLEWRRSGAALSAEILSFFTFIATVAASIYYRAATPKRLLWVVGLIAALAVSAQFSAEPPWLNNSLDTRTWDFAQKGYLHHAPQGIQFQNNISLLGYEWQIEPGATENAAKYRLTLHWESGSGNATVDLVSPAIHRVDEKRPVPVYASRTKPVAAGSVVYTFELDATDAVSTALLPRLRVEGIRPLTASGLLRGDLFLAPRINVAQTTLGESFTDLATLDSVNTLPNGNLLVKMHWATEQQLSKNYQASWKLYDKLGRFYAELDTQPGYNYLPTRFWEPNTRLNDWIELKWLADDGIEPYSLVVALRDVGSDALVYQDEIGRILTREPLRYTPTERVITAPPSATQLDASFGDQIALNGFELERYGSTQAVVLHWKALQSELPSYSRFVHLVDTATGAIVAQADSLPQFNTSPTDRWQAGFVYSDVASLEVSGLAAGEYELRVGLYQQVDDAFLRLSVRDSIDNALPLSQPVIVAP